MEEDYQLPEIDANDDFFIMHIAVVWGKEVYKEHCTGGNCHVVLDDDNVEDYFIRSTIEAPYKPPLTNYEMACMGAYLTLTEEQRLECNRRIHGR